MTVTFRLLELNGIDGLLYGIKVVEHSAYRKAVETLKFIVANPNEPIGIAIETLRELGEIE